MSRWRRNIDRTQPAIVKALRAIPGVTVQTGHNDLLVGYRGRTLWYEVKSPRNIRRDGTLGLRDRQTTARQIALSLAWTGHYRIVSTAEEIMADLGVGVEQGATCCGRSAR